MLRKQNLIFGAVFFILVGSILGILFMTQNKHNAVEDALIDFQDQPSREKMNALKRTYASFSDSDKRLYEKEFSLLEMRFRVAERKMYLKQWDLYYTLYDPLDEGYFIAFVKQYQDLIRFEHLLSVEMDETSSKYKMYTAMLDQIHADVHYGLSLKEKIDEILSVHPLTKKQIEDMPFIPVTSWIDVHNREVPDEIRISIQ